VFGLSFGEMVVLGVVAMVVVGPRNLPALLRQAGQLIGRLRRMAIDLRAESGIDEILDAEGIRSEIDNFRRLASGAISPDEFSPNVVPDREREYPRAGPDAYGAFSEDLVPYLPAELPSLLAATGGTPTVPLPPVAAVAAATAPTEIAPSPLAPSAPAPLAVPPSTRAAPVPPTSPRPSAGPPPPPSRRPLPPPVPPPRSSSAPRTSSLPPPRPPPPRASSPAAAPAVVPSAAPPIAPPMPNPESAPVTEVASTPPSRSINGAGIKR
jgi:Tat protein translocase TatB subunit